MLKNDYGLFEISDWAFIKTIFRGWTELQGNLGLTNLKGTKILFFIAEVLLLQVFFTIELTTEGLKIELFIAGIVLLKGSLYRGFFKKGPNILSWKGLAEMQLTFPKCSEKDLRKNI